MNNSSLQLFTPEMRLNFADAFITVDEKPLDLDFWQEAFLKDAGRFSITLKSRRTGFSFIVALKGLIKANDPARRNYVRQFISYNEEDAKEKIRYVQNFYNSIPKRHKKKIVSATKTSVELLDIGGRTTSRLISLACRPPRGRGGDIVFDEMAIYPRNQARIIYTAGLPVISRGGCVEIGSTPLGKMGTFYDIFTDEENYEGYRRYTVPWWLSKALCTNVDGAINTNIRDMDTDERVKEFGTEILKKERDQFLLEEFQQEFECVFIDSAMSYITLDLIYANTPGMREGERDALPEGQEESLESAKDGLEVKVFRDADSLVLGYDMEKHGRLYWGYDVARHRDAAVIFVLGLLPNGKKRAVAVIEMVNQPFEYQRDQIRKMIKSGLPVIRGCMDKTGQGEDPTETLQREFTTSVIEGVDFNIRSKEELAVGIRRGLERGEFLLHNDKRFHRHVHSIKRIPTSGGAFRYDSQRDEDGHADDFWAWALANYAIPSENATAPSFYQQWHERREHGEEAVNAKLAGGRRGKSRERVLREMLKGRR